MLTGAQVSCTSPDQLICSEAIFFKAQLPSSCCCCTSNNISATTALYQQLCLFSLLTVLSLIRTNAYLDFLRIYLTYNVKTNIFSHVKQLHRSFWAGGFIRKKSTWVEGVVFSVKKPFLHFAVFFWLNDTFPPSSARHPAAANTPVFRLPWFAQHKM